MQPALETLRPRSCQAGGDRGPARESAAAEFHGGSRSTAYLRELRRASRFARDRNAPILIEGESGTGKTSIAKLIHELSPRASAPFRSVALSTFDDALASSELFGHVVGAFTDARQSRAGHFVSANGGSLFLDELGKASIAVQQKLLHVVEYGEMRAVGSDRDIRVDVRLVGATNIPLSQLVESGKFLADLYARLELFRVVLPPLRERRSDIPALARQFVGKHANGCGYSTTPAIDEALVAALQHADWPHNLRQLDATLHRLLIEAEGADVLTLEHCTDDLAYLRSDQSLPLTSERVDDALSRAAYNITKAAKMLGVDRTTLHRFQRRRAVVQHSDERASTVAPHCSDKTLTS